MYPWTPKRHLNPRNGLSRAQQRHRRLTTDDRPRFEEMRNDRRNRQKL